MLEVNDFTTVRISLASPEQIRGWSYGEVTKPETLNYRTLKPEKDGLFCEKIFGPTKDFECYCGKYKKIRYKGIVCDKCGVEVARSKVRRERMGHIMLAAPVSHIWFVKGTPSHMGLLLDISPRNLEQVIYFAKFIVTKVDEEKKKEALKQFRDGIAQQFVDREKALSDKIESLKSQEGSKLSEDKLQQEVRQLQQQYAEDKRKLDAELKEGLDELDGLAPMTLLSASKCRELRQIWGDVFKASMGAEAVLEILSTLDLERMRQELYREAASSSGQRSKKAIKRLRVIEAFRKSANKPEWMVLTVLPVLPPELRPMVQLDGGRFATSDLNDLYRRVINRNNRLRRLLEIGAPEIITRNEKRMLQEAVDSLIDNGRRGRAVVTGNNHRLKSLSDMLRGKQGRFRQNLLGKRVDYSGRSVIVAGPELKLHQCGLPRRMALELFKPFIMRRLVARGLALNIRSAKRIVERGKPEVWDILEEVVKDRPVLLNRAPTLHRLGIQAFHPVLIGGSAIQVHPLVCVAFNADFDGDQMAVHVPLSKAAVEEANKVMLSTLNMLLPSSGDPVVAPTLDIVLGCYYLTMIKPGMKGEGMIFSSFDEARLAHEMDIIGTNAEIEVRQGAEVKRIKTSVGRIIFNDILPKELGFRNQLMDKKALKALVAECHRLLGNESTATMVDSIKGLGFHYATRSGMTIAINDVRVPQEKVKILDQAQGKISEIDKQYQRGLITEDERYNSAVTIWTQATEEIQGALERSLDKYGALYMMSSSGAKGNISQIRQMAGMRGLMTDPSGRIIDLPIKSSFREGLSVLEYFISTHGARKGLADTALRTSDSGYLTRRLIDVSQEVIVSEEDCGAIAGIWVAEPTDRSLALPLADRILGRIAASPLAHPKTGEIIVDRNDAIDEEKAKTITKAGITRVHVRSPLSCQSRRGICQRCYGRSLARGKLVSIGEAVGIIAAQSIGEPGTQLTMRTFHTGGVAGLDITSGLPRVEELFEARSPKIQAIISEIEGVAEITRTEEGRKVRVASSEVYRDEYNVPKGYEVMVETEQWVEAATVLARPPVAEGKKEEAAVAPPLIARVGGKVEVKKNRISLLYEEKEAREYMVSPVTPILVENRAKVKAGDKLTEGLIHPQDILHIRGREAVQQYLVDEVQKVYRSQGVNINDKHIEIIVRQMLRKVRVDSPGDTGFLPGDLVDSLVYEDVNAKVLAEGGEPATAKPVLLGITRASLNTDSFLAKASFQETTRVLTEAAIMGSTDRLTGLKENVIIGKLIPARSEFSLSAKKRAALPPAEAGAEAPAAEAAAEVVQEEKAGSGAKESKDSAA